MADDRDGALAALDRFCDLYATGEIPEFHDVVDIFIAWSGEILAFHDDGVGRISNGRLEGTNNKLQVLDASPTGSSTEPTSRPVAYSSVQAVRRSPAPSPAGVSP